MTSFNQFKNHTEILKKYLIKMNNISESDIKPQWIQENFLKQNNPHIFLQILHYILIKFSPFILFVKVLDYYPTIKDDSDKKFITNLMSLARKLFQIDVKIDIDQFLGQKFVEKKTQFTSTFCRAAYQYHLKENKSSSNPSLSSNLNTKGSLKKQNELTNYIPTKLQSKYALDDDSQDEMPRNLNMAPSNSQRPVVNKIDIQDSSSDQDLKQLRNKKKQLNKVKQKQTVGNSVINSIGNKASIKNQPQQIARNQNKKGLVFPKYLKKDEGQDQQNEFIKQSFANLNGDRKTSNQYQNTKEVKNHNKPENPNFSNNQAIQNRNNNAQRNHQQIDTSQYVSREEFMEIVTGITINFTELLTKFNDFQSQVGGWVQNVNAKISILQENVKTIKNNL